MNIYHNDKIDLNKISIFEYTKIKNNMINFYFFSKKYRFYKVIKSLLQIFSIVIHI